MDANVLKLTISDLMKIKEEDKRWVAEYGQGTGTSFSRDPDSGTLDDRLSGRFDWAFSEIAKHKDSSGLGNVDSLQPDYEFGLLDGTEIDFDQYMIHNPRCMGRIVQNEAPNGERTINLAVCVGMSGMTHATVLAQNSAAAMAVAKKYEDAGYSVRLTAVLPFKNIFSGDIGIVAVDCSRASVGQAVSIMCSALVFRSLIFDAIEKIGISPNEAQAVSRHQNSGLLPKMAELIKRNLGNDVKIVWTGDSDQQIMDAMK